MTTRKPGGAWKWLICGILFLATVLNYLDRQTMALCAPLISKEFNLTNEDFGRLLSSFRWAYAVLHIPAGFIVDHFSVRLVYALAVALWSLAGGAAGFVRSASALTWTRMGLGVGEAFNWPCGLRVIANLLPPRDRGLGNGMFQSGTATGALLAPVIIAPIAQTWGWRAAFIMIGALGGVWVVLWVIATLGRSVETGECSHGAAEDIEASHSSAGTPSASVPFMHQLAVVLSNPGFWVLLLAAGTINPCLYFVAEWTAKYLHDQRGFDVLGAGLLTVPIFLGLDLGNLAGGGLVKYLTYQGWSLRRARVATVFIGALLALSATLVNMAPNTTVFVMLLSVAGLGIAAIMTNWLACIQELSFANVGLAMGLLGAFGCVVGATLNPFIGRYVDKTGHYHLIFIMLGLAPVAAGLSILAFSAVCSPSDKSHRPDGE